MFGRFKRYGYAIVTFGQPVSVDDFIRSHPAVLSEPFEARKAELQRLAELVMTEISNALPVTPVTLVAHLFRQHDVLTEAAMLREIGRLREEWRDRNWLIREKAPAEIWKAARQVLELRRLIVPVEQWRDDLFDDGGVPAIEDAWRWNEEARLLRDYYANALIPFGELATRYE